MVLWGVPRALLFVGISCLRVERRHRNETVNKVLNSELGFRGGGEVVSS